MGASLLLALLLVQQIRPDLSNPYERAVAEWADCARMAVHSQAATTNRRDSGVVDRAIRDCRANEEALRTFLQGRSSAEEADRGVAEIKARIRRSLMRYVRGISR